MISFGKLGCQSHIGSISRAFPSFNFSFCALRCLVWVTAYLRSELTKLNHRGTETTLLESESDPELLNLCALVRKSPPSRVQPDRKFLCASFVSFVALWLNFVRLVALK